MDQSSVASNEPARPGPPVRSKSGAVTAIRGAFVLFGLGLLALAIWVGAVARASFHWPTAEGIVIAAEIVQHAGGPRGAPHSRARIQYQYTVDGQSHRNDVLGFKAGSSRFGSDPQAIVVGYAVGAPVTVSYDPEDPRQSVLEPGAGGISSPSVLLSLFGALAIITGIALGPYLRRQARSHASSRARPRTTTGPSQGA